MKLQVQINGWQAAYDVYRQSPTWAEKRHLVFQRSHRLCEGCRIRLARELHHLRYPPGLVPGSADTDPGGKAFRFSRLVRAHLTRICMMS
jgi:hypothetical protein